MDSTEEPQIFRLSDTPIMVFVEASEMVGRAKVVKQLKKHGADVCITIQEATLIVVDPETTAGRLIIREWGSTQDKVVLHHSWITECIKEKRLLDERDNWGGCIAQDDGLAIENEVSEEEQQNLPPLRRRSVENRNATSNSAVPQATSAPSTLPSACTQDSSTSRSVSCPVPNTSRRNPGSPPSSSTALFADAQNPLTSRSVSCPVSNEPTRATLSAHQNPSASTSVSVPPYAPAASSFQNFPSVCSSLSQYPNSSVPPSAASFLGALSPTSSSVSSPSQGPQVPNALQGMSFPPQFSSFPFPSAPAGMPFPQIPLMAFSPYLGNPMFCHMIAEQYRLALHAGALPGFPGTIPNEAKTEGNFVMKHSPSPDTIPALNPDSARSLVDVYNTASTSKGKEPASTASNHPISSGPPIFVNSNQSPLKFFVQIELRDRHKVISMIKKHGGKITNRQEDADFSILSPKSNTFASLLKTSNVVKTPAIAALFVEECVAKSTLLEHTPYILSSVGSPVRVKEEKVKEEKVKEKKVQAEMKHKRKAESVSEPKVKVKKPRKAATSTLLPNLLPYRESPPPPAEHFRKRLDDGRFLYSTQELEYAVEYAEILLQRDHEMPVSVIAKKLHEKMPHHSAKSWTTTINKQNAAVRDQITRARNRAGVAYRTAYAKRQAQSPVQNSDPRERELEEDFKAIVNFFMNHDDGSEEDANVVWGRLENMTSCKTQASWADFWKVYWQEVNRRLDEAKKQSVATT